MKSRKGRFVLVLCSLCLVSIVTAISAQMPMPEPTEHHGHFKDMEGEWDATMKMMEMEVPGVEKNEVVCGGLWLKTEYESELMGQPFEGLGLTGYDPEKGKYVMMWIDSGSMTWIISEGDLEGTTMTLWSMMPNMSGEMVKTKMVEEMPDKDTRILTFSQKGEDGKDVETMSISYKRRK